MNHYRFALKNIRFFILQPGIVRKSRNILNIQNPMAGNANAINFNFTLELLQAFRYFITLPITINPSIKAITVAGKKNRKLNEKLWGAYPLTNPNRCLNSFTTSAKSKIPKLANAIR